MTTREVEKLIRHNYQSTFAGKYPEISHFNGTTEDDIRDEFEGAVFITLPIAHDGRTAYDGMVYTSEFNDDLIHSINTGQIGGNETHLESMKGQSSPPVLWLGAIRDEDGVIWAKGFVWEHRLGEFFKAVKVAHSSIGTSIYGFVEDIESLVFEEGGAFSIKQGGFKLLSLDLVPSGQEGLQFEERGMLQVSANADIQEKKKEAKMELSEVITALRGLTEDEIRNLPADLRHAMTQVDAIDAERETELTELRETVSEHEQSIVQRDTAITELSSALLDERLDRVIAQSVNVEGEVGEALRAFVRNAVNVSSDELPDTFEAVEELVHSVMEDTAYKTIAQAVVDTASGGKAIVGVKESLEGEKTDRDKRIDDAVKNSRELLESIGAGKTLRVFKDKEGE